VAAVSFSLSCELQCEWVEGEDEGEEGNKRGWGGIEGRKGEGMGEKGGWEKGELRGDPRAASSRRAHVAAGNINNEEKKLDGGGVKIAVVVH
jgi:hypothetical protein